MKDNISIILSVDQLLKKEEYVIEFKEPGKETKLVLPTERIYHIPAYQREIRWNKKNVRVLIKDIKSNDKFLGTVLMSTKDYKDYDIIDGQQRITVLFLLLLAIKKQRSLESLCLCEFKNETYKCLFDVIDLDFCFDRIKTHANKTEYLNSDILEQRTSFEEIWLEIKEQLSELRPEDLIKLQNNILNSEINLIINHNNSSSTSQSICVDYYLDLNDKSVELDSIDILKAELFRIDFELMSQRWSAVQSSIKELHIAGILNYSISSFYYHYFACTINEQLQYQLNTLKTNLKLGKNITIKNKNHLVDFSAETHIVQAVFDNGYFLDSVNNLKKAADFMTNIVQNSEPSLEFKNYFSKECSDTTIKCAFHMINAILRNDNEVPKMLVMKYFLEVLNKTTSKKKDFNSIYDIYSYSVLFSATNGKKQSQQLTRIVMAEKWQERIKEALVELYKNTIDEVAYKKAISYNGKVTTTSGQYFPKHIFAVKEFYELSNGEKAVIVKNKKNLCSFLTDPDRSAEHFFINKSYSFEFYYDGNKKETIACPAKLKKYISYVVNYLYIDSNVNNEMGDLTIFDKIKYLDKKLNESKQKKVFSNELSYSYFLKAKDIFCNGKYPRDLGNIKSKNIAKKMVRDYYINYFLTELDSYIDEIKLLK